MEGRVGASPATSAIDRIAQEKVLRMVSPMWISSFQLAREIDRINRDNSKWVVEYSPGQSGVSLTMCSPQNSDFVGEQKSRAYAQFLSV